MYIYRVKRIHSNTPDMTYKERYAVEERGERFFSSREKAFEHAYRWKDRYVNKRDYTCLATHGDSYMRESNIHQIDLREDESVLEVVGYIELVQIRIEKLEVN